MQHLVQATAAFDEDSLEDLESEAYSDDKTDSDDSVEGITEDERQQFLEARDLFINAKCARIANMEVEECL